MFTLLLTFTLLNKSQLISKQNFKRYSAGNVPGTGNKNNPIYSKANVDIYLILKPNRPPDLGTTILL